MYPNLQTPVNSQPSAADIAAREGFDTPLSRFDIGSLPNYRPPVQALEAVPPIGAMEAVDLRNNVSDDENFIAVKGGGYYPPDPSKLTNDPDTVVGVTATSERSPFANVELAAKNVRWARFWLRIFFFTTIAYWCAFGYLLDLRGLAIGLPISFIVSCCLPCYLQRGLNNAFTKKDAAVFRSKLASFTYLTLFTAALLFYICGEAVMLAPEHMGLPVLDFKNTGIDGKADVPEKAGFALFEATDADFQYAKQLEVELEEVREKASSSRSYSQSTSSSSYSKSKASTSKTETTTPTPNPDWKPWHCHDDHRGCHTHPHYSRGGWKKGKSSWGSWKGETKHHYGYSGGWWGRYLKSVFSAERSTFAGRRLDHKKDHYHEQGLSFSAANALCRKKGYGHLARICSDREWFEVRHFVRQALRKEAYNKDKSLPNYFDSTTLSYPDKAFEYEYVPFWVGIHDAAQSGFWQYLGADLLTRKSDVEKLDKSKIVSEEDYQNTCNYADWENGENPYDHPVWRENGESARRCAAAVAVKECKSWDLAYGGCHSERGLFAPRACNGAGSYAGEESTPGHDYAVRHYVCGTRDEDSDDHRGGGRGGHHKHHDHHHHHHNPVYDSGNNNYYRVHKTDFAFWLRLFHIPTVVLLFVIFFHIRKYLRIPSFYAWKHEYLGRNSVTSSSSPSAQIGVPATADAVYVGQPVQGRQLQAIEQGFTQPQVQAPGVPLALPGAPLHIIAPVLETGVANEVGAGNGVAAGYPVPAGKETEQSAFTVSSSSSTEIRRTE